jgi:hypothetical protein
VECARLPTPFSTSYVNHTNWTECRDWYNKNSLLVHVYYRTLTIIALDEQPALEVCVRTFLVHFYLHQLSDAILQFGGTAGLCTGAGPMMIIETMGLVVSLIIIACCKPPEPAEPEKSAQMKVYKHFILTNTQPKFT